ncbi:MAG: hypothetical protein RLY20_2489 [Verrucomicrobiota bacterium]
MRNEKPLGGHVPHCGRHDLASSPLIQLSHDGERE